ncbi:MAG: sporulation integral membrane protein YtvI [Syntrophomonadaceae bacterium]|jgi:sporulation integral membrane protein YtvI
MDPELQKNFKILTRLAIIVMALVAIYLLFTYVFPILASIISYLPILFLPFILALILALIIEPVIRFFQRKIKIKRVWAVVLSLVIIVGGFIYLIAMIISSITKEIYKLYPQVVSYSDQIIKKVIESIADIELFYISLNLPEPFEVTIKEKLGETLKLLQSSLDGSLNFLMGTITVLPGVIIFLMIVIIATFFIAKDRKLLVDFAMRYIPGTAHSQTIKVITELSRALVGFLKAYSILITITAIITIVSLKILQIDYILTIGIIVGICDILPVLGPGTIFVPWILWEMINGNNGMALSLLVIYVIISIVRQLLEPKIVGDNIGLHPLATLISLYIGLQLGGIIGMIMGPVLLVIFIACYRVGIFKNLGWGKRK